MFMFILEVMFKELISFLVICICCLPMTLTLYLLTINITKNIKFSEKTKSRVSRTKERTKKLLRNFI